MIFGVSPRHFILSNFFHRVVLTVDVRLGFLRRRLFGPPPRFGLSSPGLPNLWIAWAFPPRHFLVWSPDILPLLRRFPRFGRALVYESPSDGSLFSSHPLPDGRTSSSISPWPPSPPISPSHRSRTSHGPFTTPHAFLTRRFRSVSQGRLGRSPR